MIVTPAPSATAVELGPAGVPAEARCDHDSMRILPRLAVGCLAAALSASGCGSSDAKRAVSKQPAASPTQIVRAWADTLRRGDTAGATRFFAVPSLVSNGAPPQSLTSAAQIRLFNESLPCGARLVGTERAPHGFLIATFVLTERPGPGTCASGTGQTARTAFRVRRGHITDWLRVQDIPVAPATRV